MVKNRLKFIRNYVKVMVMMQCLELQSGSGSKSSKKGCTDVHDESHSGHPSVITEEIVTTVQDKIWKDHSIKISELHECFPRVRCGIVKDC